MEIRIATTLEEKQKIYSLRYECYVAELGWKYDEVGVEKRELCDPEDETGVLYCAINDSGRVVATNRINFGGELVIPQKWREHQDLSRFADFSEADFCFCFRFVVAPEFRGSSLSARILMKCYEDVCKRGVKFTFLCCRPKLVELYERLGFIRYKDNVLESIHGYMVPMVLLVNDVKHLETVGSMFLKICKRFNPSPATAEWFDRNFPGVRDRAEKRLLSPEEFWQEWAKAMSADEVALLQGLSVAQVQVLLQSGSVLKCRAGDTLLREGEAGHEMFLILEGLAQFTRRMEDGSETVLRTQGKGEVFGEIALLGQTKRTASVVAATDLQVLVISQEFLQRAMRALPDVAIRLLYNLSAVLCDKLRTVTNDWMGERQKAGSELSYLYR